MEYLYYTPNSRKIQRQRPGKLTEEQTGRAVVCVRQTSCTQLYIYKKDACVQIEHAKMICVLVHASEKSAACTRLQFVEYANLLLSRDGVY